MGNICWILSTRRTASFITGSGDVDTPSDGPNETDLRDATEADPSRRSDTESTFDYRPGESIGYLIRDCYRSLAKLLESYIAPSGVKMGQWYFLRELWEEDGLTQRELSDRVGMMEPTTVVAVRGLIDAGLVTRVRDPEDRRKLRVNLTPKARRLKNKLLPFAFEVNAKATQGLSPEEIHRFRDTIGRIKRNLT